MVDMRSGLKMVGAASVLVGGLFHLGGPAVFTIPVLGNALAAFWNFGIGPVTVQRLFGLIATLYGANALGLLPMLDKLPVVGGPISSAVEMTERAVVPE
tara:strand:- start:481 stop:777 length:297 start_codon:yes stop_codon:yes gene_type:complete